MTKWLVGLVVVIILAGLGWFFRGAIGGLFGSTTTAPQQVAEDPLAGWGSYASSTMGISLRYPQGFTVNEAYADTSVSVKKPIAGVSFTIPPAMATGTNLSSDTYLSVEQLPR